MASNFPLAAVFEEIEEIVEVIEEGISYSTKKCDTYEHVRDLRQKLVIDYERLEDMHDYIVL